MGGLCGPKMEPTTYAMGWLEKWPVHSNQEVINAIIHCVVPQGTLRLKYWLGGSSEVQILDLKNKYENRQGLKEIKLVRLMVSLHITEHPPQYWMISLYSAHGIPCLPVLNTNTIHGTAQTLPMKSVLPWKVYQRPKEIASKANAEQ